jgi:tetratricopeptide (TPR) repeat protein
MDDRLEEARKLVEETEKLCDAGSFVQAEALAKKALRIREELLGKEHALVAQALRSLAVVQMNMGHAMSALPLAKRSATIYEAGGDATRKDYAATLDTVAQLHSLLGQLDEACGAATDAMEEMAKAMGDRHPELASVILTVAMLTVDIGEAETGLELYERARKIFEANDGWEVHEALSWRGAADAHLALGEPKKARAACIRALEIASPKLRADHPMLHEIVKTLDEIGKPPSAALN